MEYEHFTPTHITYRTEDPVAPFLALLSLTPPFAVCALCSSITIYKDVLAAFLLTGLIACAAVCSVAKDVIGQPRPDRYNDVSDDEVEYGMPSNHSAFSFFGAAFVTLYVLRGGCAWSWRLPGRADAAFRRDTNGGAPGTSGVTDNAQWRTLSRVWCVLHNQVTVLAVLMIAIGCAYSRVYLGYHTTNQVVVGSIVGGVLGSAWYGLYEVERVRYWLHWVDCRIQELEMTRVQSLLHTDKDH